MNLLHLQGMLGLAVFLGGAVLCSSHRQAIQWRVIGTGLLLQGAVAWLFLRVPFFQHLFLGLNQAVHVLQEATLAGTSFVYGYAGGGEAPFAATGNTFILAFQALPLIMVIGALSGLLFYWGVLPWVIRGVSLALERSLGVGGALGLGVASNIFLGFDATATVIRPHLKDLSRSELFAFMTSGMSHVAGTVMLVYATLLEPIIPGVIRHIIAASVINVPAALTIARLLEPEMHGTTSGTLQKKDRPSSVMDAIARGATEGAMVLINITAMLITLVALVHLVNTMLGACTQSIGGVTVTLQQALGYLLAPVAWLMGIPAGESLMAGTLIGTKTVLNEILAYADMAQHYGSVLSERTRVLLTYGLCGFANFGSVGIMIGVIGTLVPERRKEVAALGLRAMMSGTVATCMTGTLVGLWL